MPSRYRCMRKFPGYQAALLNQNWKDISTPSDRTCYFFGMPMEIKPVTLHAKTRKELAVYQVFLGGQRLLHQECCRSHHVISAWNLTMHRIPDLYNFILNSSEAPTLHSSKPKTSSSSSRPSSQDSPSCHPVPTSLGTPKRPRQLSSLPCVRLFLWWLSSVSYFYSCWESGVDVIRAGQWEDIVNN